jgi:hypothetical protein
LVPLFTVPRGFGNWFGFVLAMVYFTDDPKQIQSTTRLAASFSCPSLQKFAAFWMALLRRLSTEERSVA